MVEPIKENIAFLESAATSLPAAEAIEAISGRFPGRAVFSTSFSFEDQAITHMIAAGNLGIRIFTLDTGRLFPETYSVWRATNERYGMRVQAYYPEAAGLESYVSQNGPNAFYESIELRKACCHIRKVVPLKRALEGASVWITGLRAEHSKGRQEMTPVEWDESNRILKFHPLLHWSTAEVKQYISDHNIPYNPLHDRGFVSIGCAPCTRAIRPGEDFRAGRWWWEDNSGKECGLHVHNQPKKDEITTS